MRFLVFDRSQRLVKRRRQLDFHHLYRRQSSTPMCFLSFCSSIAAELLLHRSQQLDFHHLHRRQSLALMRLLIIAHQSRACFYGDGSFIPPFQRFIPMRLLSFFIDHSACFSGGGRLISTTSECNTDARSNYFFYYRNACCNGDGSLISITYIDVRD